MPVAYAGYPAPVVREQPGSKKKVKQLLWGDWLTLTGAVENGWVEVEKARGAHGWMREEDVQTERLLELNFVDVGQGDGCFIVTPEDRRILIDAGRADNMFWYLRWRFNLREHPDWTVRIDDALISHPDADHYEGFRPLFEDPHFEFGNVYHNGLVDHAHGNRLGATVPDGGHDFFTELYSTTDELRAALPGLNPSGRLMYPKLLQEALDGGRVANIQSVSTHDGHLPDFTAAPLAIKLLGPLLEFPGGTPGLRDLGDEGVTKNGHSIVMLLTYGNVRMLLGGDLNAESMDLLLQAHQGANDNAFKADVAKACHHGSGDVSAPFVQGINALATIISSGDDESYSHPRPDALGLLGKHGRGDRPLIFSTELARSSREMIEVPHLIQAVKSDELDEARRAIIATGSTDSEKPNRTAARFQRAVAVYGMICVRTDGKRVVLAQKLEREAAGKSWDVHCLVDGPNGLVYAPGDS